MIFVDTTAWYAVFVSNDAHTRAARNWLEMHGGEVLITTDFVIDELLTLLRGRNESQRAVQGG